MTTQRDVTSNPANRTYAVNDRQELFNIIQDLQSELEQAEWTETEPLKERINQLAEAIGSISHQNSSDPVLFSAIASKIRRTTDLESLLSLTVSELQSKLKVDRAFIYRLTGPKMGVVEAEAIRDGYTPSLGENLPTVSFGLENSPKQQQKPCLINDVYQANLTPYQIQMMERFQVNASLSVPILTGEGIWGYLVIQQCTAARTWQGSEISLLERISQELVVQLQVASIREQFRQQMVKEETLGKIVDRIRQSLNLQDIFNNTVRELRRFLGADRVGVFQFYPDSGYDDGEFVAEDVVGGFPSALAAKIHDRCFGRDYAHKYVEGAIQAVADIYNAGLKDCHIEILSQFAVRANLIVPLIKNKELWGLLAVQQCSAPRVWQDEEIKFIQQVTAQFGIALQQAQTLQQVKIQSETLQKRFEREKTLKKIIERIRQSLNLQDIFNNTVRELRRFLNADRVGVFEFYPDSGYDDGEFVAEDVVGGFPSALAAKIHDHCFGREYAHKYAEGAIQATADIHNAGLKDCHIEVLTQFGIRANLIVPLLKGNQLWGLLAVQQCSAPRQWQEDEIDFIQQVATQFGVALQQAENLKQMEAQSQALAKRIEREKTLNKIVERIRQSLNLEDIFNNTVRELRRFLNADRVGVFEFYPDSGYDDGEFVAEDVVGGFPSALAAKIHDHCFGREYAHKYAEGAIQATADIHNAGLKDCHIEVLTQFGIRANLIVPLLKGNQLWGLLAVQQCSAPRQWQAEEIEFIQQVASQFGVALQQAETLKQLETQNQTLGKRVQQEQTIGKIVDRIRQSIDLPDLFNLSIREIREFLNCDRAGIFKFDVDSDYDFGEFICEDVVAGYTSAMQVKVRDHCYAKKYASKHETGWVSVLPDINKGNLQKCHISILSRFEVKANIVAPLFKGQELWGLLCVYQCDAPRHWQADEIEFVRQVASQFGVAIQQKQYLQQVEKRTEDLLRIAKLDQEVIKIIEKIPQNSNGLRDIFNYATRELRIFLRSERVTVYRFLPDWSGEYLAESIGGDWTPFVDPNLKTVWEDEHLQSTQGGRYRNGETFAVDDIHTVGHAQCHIDILEQFQIKSYAIAPIFIGKKLWGLLAAYQHSNTRHWEENEVQLLTKVGVQLGVALQQAESIEQLRKNNEELARSSEDEKAISRVIDKIRLNQDLDAIFRNVLPDVRQIINCDRLAVYQFKPDWSGEFIAESVASGWVSFVGPDLKTVWTDDRFQETQGGLYRNNETLVFNDVTKAGHVQCHLDILAQFQIKASITAPIFVGDRLWGILAAYQHQAPRQWRNNEVQLVTKLGSQIGVGLQQAEYLKQLKEKNNELARANEQEKALSRVIDKIRQSQDLDGIFRNVLSDVRLLMKCHRLSVYRFFPDWSGEYIAESVGSQWPVLVGPDVKTVWKDEHLQMTQGGRYRNEETFAVNNVHTIGHSQCHVDLLDQFHIKAYVVAPIMVGKKLWGLLAAYRHDDYYQWPAHEIQLVTKLGSQLGLAVQQAEYLQQLKEKNNALARANEQEKAISRVIDKIRQSQTLDNIFRNVLSDVRLLMKCDRLTVYRFAPDWSGEYIAESVSSEWPIWVGTDMKTVWKDEHLQLTQGGRYRNEETFAVNNVHTVGHSQCHVDILDQFQIKAYVIAPIMTGKKLWGLLAAYRHDDYYQWQPNEIQLVTKVGAQLGLGVQQAQYIQEIESRSQELSDRNERETAIIQFSARLSSILVELIQNNQNYSTFLDFAIREMRRILKTDRVGVYRFNPDFSGEFIIESVNENWPQLVGTELAKVKDTFFQQTKGGRFARKESMYANDIHQTNHEACHINFLEQWGTKAYMVAPIFKGEQLWGLLGAYQNNSPRNWQNSEVSLVEQVGTQIGIALQLSEYLQQVRRQEEQLQSSAQRDKLAREQLQHEAMQILRAIQPSFQGDLTVRAPLSETELGTIADGYNTTIQSMRTLVSKVQTTAIEVTKTSSTNNSYVVELSMQAQQQVQQLEKALQRLNLMLASTQAVATDAQKVESAVQEANRTVQAGDSLMERTVDGMLEIRETVSETAKKIKHLGETSQKISKVVNLIENFATQTNLLALNAAIEATRAGEYGKGFAVVADEVRSLAYQSANATTEIERLVQDIQGEINEVTEVMEVGISQVVQGSSLIDETRQSLNAIVVATGQISNLVQGITHTTSTQGQHSQELTEAMKDVSTIARKTSESSVRIADSFHKLLETSQELETSVSRFKVD